MNLRPFVFIFILFCSFQSIVSAQVYETIYRTSQQRMELLTPHFRIIFPAGEESIAWHSARILEDQYPIIQALTGGSLKRFPVILNNQNDLSNGFVTPINFRTEIEIPSIHGLTMNPRTGGWMETVAPHELVHALHFSNMPKYSIPQVISWFSPDLARSLHSMAPFGMIEGIAVYHESNIVFGEGGRGNYPFFTNRVLSANAQGSVWSLAQHLQPTRFNRPLDRHYSAGHSFISWLQWYYGPETTRKSIETFVRYPFLGYGFALNRATGMNTSTLFQEYSTHLATAIETHIDSIQLTSEPDYAILLRSIDGLEARNPVWLTDEHLLISLPGQFSMRQGFYRLNVHNEQLEMVLETSQVRDYALWMDEDTMYFSRFHAHPWANNTATMDVHAFSLSHNKKTRLTTSARVRAPFKINGTLHALMNVSETSQWVRKNESGEWEMVLDISPDHIERVLPTPGDNEKFAVILNRNGVQGIWMVELSNINNVKNSNPTIAFRNGSILDANWSADGSSIFFTADATGVMNIYRYDLAENTLHQITNSRFNAFNPSLSKDGNYLAFITQDGDAQRPAIMKKDDFLMQEIQPVEWQPNLIDRMNRPRLGSHLTTTSEDWKLRPYRSGLRWLRPRTLVPITTPADGFVNQRFGVSLWGADVLSQHSYVFDVSYSNEHLWSEFVYTNTTFYPGYNVELFSRPLTTTSGLLLERGGGIYFPFRWVTQSNVRHSWFTFRPGIKLRSLRMELTTVNPDIRDTFRTDWLTDTSIAASLAYYHRIQQNIRDIQPNTGTVVYWQGEHSIETERVIRPSGMRAGIMQFLSPSLSANHSIRLSAEVITQSKSRIFGTSGLVYEGFEQNVLAGLHNAGSLKTRYVLPLAYIDDGWISVPLFFERVYMALQTNTVLNLNSNQLQETSRTVFGIELRADIRLYNLPINLGIGLGWEPTRNNWNLFGGGATIQN